MFIDPKYLNDFMWNAFRKKIIDGVYTFNKIMLFILNCTRENYITKKLGLIKIMFSRIRVYSHLIQINCIDSLKYLCKLLSIIKNNSLWGLPVSYVYLIFSTIAFITLFVIYAILIFFVTSNIKWIGVFNPVELFLCWSFKF